MAIRVLVYDDNEALRASIGVLIDGEEGMELLAALPNAETVETDIRQLQPDVVLMDIDMPVVNGVTAVQRIRAIDASLPVIMLTIFDDTDNIFQAVCAGASGYLLKQYITDELSGAIRMVLAGGAPMTGSVAKKVLTMVPRAAVTQPEANGLSEKETAILQLLVQGYSYKMMATELGVSIDTIRFHIKKIYDKLHVHSAAGAVSRAIRDKLV
ncbi:response regulator transcription factor [Paraflavitalea pollutisoli]|uniref:response regulator transcription factor n=1 Tax=Paraflavitalea pollutisoli TaxID=3034143 RepID=UPI0023EC6721|nr:response regulator transcription factor [Paraflavitalea sp. H1-2-19X]